MTLAIFGARPLSPYYAATIPYWNLALAFGMVLLIAVVSGYIGVRKVLGIEPFDIFRGRDCLFKRRSGCCSPRVRQVRPNRATAPLTFEYRASPSGNLQAAKQRDLNEIQQ